MEPIKPPVAALDDTTLENVSGGGDPLMALQMFGLGQQMGQALATPFIPLINDSAFEVQYGEAMRVLATYNDNTTYSLEEKALRFAESWNTNHQGGGMTMEIATAILNLGEDNPKAQVVIACQPNIKRLISAYNQFMSTGQI